MTRGAVFGAAVAALAFGVQPGARPATVAAGEALVLPAFDAAPAADLRIVRTHQYVMSGAVRPLLFWIGRDDIGLARIVWREGADGVRAYELLVGTDPARAPRAINRWGFVSEERRGAGGSLLALMTGSHDTSYDAEASAVSHGAGNGDFSTIRSRTGDGAVAWQLARVRTPEALTVHQVASVLEYARRNVDEGARRQRVVPRDVRSGFLVAVADLVADTMAGARRGSTAAPARSVQYMFGSKTYDLRVRTTDRTTAPGNGPMVAALHMSFEIKALENGETTRFDLTTGTTGDLAGVPLVVEWQPRWWLRVNLRLANTR